MLSSRESSPFIAPHFILLRESLGIVELEVEPVEA